MGEDSCADSAGPHPEAGCVLAGHLMLTAVLTVLLVKYFLFLPFSWVKAAVQTVLTVLLVFYFMFLPFSWVKTAVQTVQGHILRLDASCWSSRGFICAYCSTCYILYVLTVLMGEDSCADSAGPHPEAGGQLAGHIEVTAVLTVLLVRYFMFLPFSWVKTAVQTVQGHILRPEADMLTDVLTVLLFIYFMFLPFSWVKTAVQTVQGHILRLDASWLVILR
jgi:hypothetical protein